MKFSPDGRYLALSTKKRLLLLGLRKENSIFSVCSWMELDCSLKKTAMFSVDFITKKSEVGAAAVDIDKVVIWKVEDRATESGADNNRSCSNDYNDDVDMESTPIIEGRVESGSRKSKRCGVSRKELSANMWNDIIQTIKYIE